MAMHMNMKIPAIPVLEKNQYVKDWRKLYLAATSGMKPEDQIASLPLYVGRLGRDPEEQNIVELCTTGKTTLGAVLDEFQEIVDGSPSKMDLFNNVFELKPKSNDFSGITNFYFRLAKDGSAAGMTHDLIMMRFLKFVRNGRNFYEENKSKIVNTMTSADSVGLFKKLQAKLQSEPSVNQTKIKEELPEIEMTMAEIETDYNEQSEIIKAEIETDEQSEVPLFTINTNVKTEPEENNIYSTSHQQNVKTEIVTGEQSEVTEDCFPCPHCPHNAATSIDLEVHIRTCNMVGEKNSICDICEKKFANSNLLKKHIITVHEKIAAFPCPVAQESILATGEKNFMCNICEKNFARRRDLPRHMKTVHDKIRPFKCPHCPYGATKRGILQKHIRTRHT